MVLKFHMQHDKAAGLQNGEIQPGRESKMATVARNSSLEMFSTTIALRVKLSLGALCCLLTIMFEFML